MKVYIEIETLISYAILHGLVKEEDRILVTNAVLESIGCDSYTEFTKEEQAQIAKRAAEIVYPTELLDSLVEWAAENGTLSTDTLTFRDLLNSKIMGQVLPRTSVIRNDFWHKYQSNKEQATQFFYELNKQSNYIRTDRIAKNILWEHESSYGNLEITINLSKPEKDPRDIAAQKDVIATNYPKCLLCKENEGYMGRVNHAGRQNLRTIKLDLANEEWFFQYSPYIYYNEHCIVFSSEHRPMKIDKACFEHVLGFVEQFPHYFLSSNADLPIVGGSILSHDHFQGGRHVFPMEKATIKERVSFKGFEDVEAGIVNWPMSVLRLRGDKERLIALADVILQSWINYSDESLGIYSHTEGVRHNTVNPVARFKNGKYELDLALRNNRTDTEHPMGIFHPYEHLHNIKKENIGIIEVMGLAILPGRLKTEMASIKTLLSEAITAGNAFSTVYSKMNADSALQKHTQWLERYVNTSPTPLSIKNLDNFINRSIGDTFCEVLENCGVFKHTPKGEEGFRRFVAQVKCEPHRQS